MHAFLYNPTLIFRKPTRSPLVQSIEPNVNLTNSCLDYTMRLSEQLL